MNQPTNYILYNGEIFNSDERLFTRHNRAFRYGDGLFETMHASRNEIQFLKDHVLRLQEGMKILKMNPSESLSFSVLQNQIKRLLVRNRLYKGARVRLTVFRNEGGLYSPETNEISYLIEANSIDEEFYVLNRYGMKAGLFTEITKDCGITAKLKSTNCIPYVMAGVWKKEKQLDEALLCNSRGSIIEAVSSNVFLVKDDSITTPPVEDGCIPGVMRKQLIQLCKSHKIPLKFKSISREDVNSADEVFTTNVISGIRWILALDEQRYYNGMAKKLTEFLNQETFS